MILESLKSSPAKVIHIFDLSGCDGNLKPVIDKDGSLKYPHQNEFKIGRSVESDMKIADISVSRVHSYIRFEGKNLIIEDNGSKFGTMVKVNKPHKMLEMKYNKEPKEPLINPFTGKVHAPINSSIY
jgi:hypothetical protein